VKTPLQPPDGGWSLRRVAYHVGRGFYAFWLDQALPDEPVERYAEAGRRFQARLRQLSAETPTPGYGFVGREGALLTLQECVLAVLAAERHAQAEIGQTRTAGSMRLMPCAPGLHAVGA
jgi:hypothetical protein